VTTRRQSRFLLKPVATTLWVSAVVSLTMPHAARAQSSVALTPDRAVELARAASHRLAEGQARTDVASAAIDGRTAAGRPIVTVLAGYTRTNHVDEYGLAIPGQPPRIIYPDVPDNWRARLDVQWPLYTGGRQPALVRAASSERDATVRDVQSLDADTRFDATRAFWVAHTAIQARRVVSESLRRIEAHLRDIQHMKDAGLVAPSDVLLAEARRSRERLFLIDATNAVAIAEADLRRVTGLPASAVTTLAVPDPDLDAGGAASDIDALVRQARQTRPERQALELRTQALAEREAAAAAGADYARPNPRIFPRAAEWNPSFDVGINVVWNAWDGGRSRADAAEAAASRRAAIARLAEFDRQLEFDVTQRCLDLDSAKAAVVAARDGERTATEAHRVVTERFKAGLISSTDVLDAQVALDQAQMDVTRAEAGVRLAQARLTRVLGR